MADEPELKTSTRQRKVSPLMMAWATVIILLGLTFSWITFSDDTSDNLSINQEAASDIASSEGPEVETQISLPNTEVESSPGSDDIDNVGTQNAAQNPAAEIAPAVVPTSVSNQVSAFSNSHTPLTPAPNENLLVRGENGLKPALGPDGLLAWKEYARPYTGSDDTPRIAIMITDIGLNTRSSTAAIENLPGQVDLAFSPYGRNLQNWMDQARARGHEGFLMIPTEPLNYPENDPGPHTLITEMSERDNLLRLDWVLSQVTGYVGVVNHMGSKFTASEEALNPIITDLQGRGLMLVDARSTRFSMAARIARRMSMPRALNDRYIDNVLTREEIQRQLGELENTASTFGAALGLARATPITINEIAAWAQSLEAKGIDLVPVTAIANRQPIK